MSVDFNNWEMYNVFILDQLNLYEIYISISLPSNTSSPLLLPSLFSLKTVMTISIDGKLKFPKFKPQEFFHWYFYVSTFTETVSGSQ